MVDDEYAGEEDAKVIDVVDNYSMTKITFTKKQFKKYIGKHMKAIEKKLIELKKTEEEIKNFKDQAKAFYKFIFVNFDNMDFYMNSCQEAHEYAGLGLAHWAEGLTAPRFYYLEATVTERKC